ncbi:Uncharacterized protein dnm_083750 [Desulfonema magnum]|uniref:Uncharacterized protein n=1 Tax=Desulfonema magnum TaxID=45655 RepID=A0A975BVK6_9BACT|nr:Uncharacterized protein dnm_083750 [Desulfonema magnum]
MVTQYQQIKKVRDSAFRRSVIQAGVSVFTKKNLMAEL